MLSCATRWPVTDASLRYFMVHCHDAPGTHDLRAATAAAHRQYIEQHRSRLFMGGPLLDDAGTRRIGSLLVLKAASRVEAKALMDAEPYNSNGVFESVIIRAFDCAVRPTDEHEQEQQ